MSVLTQQMPAKGKYICHINANGELECEWKEPSGIIWDLGTPPSTGSGAILSAVNTQAAGNTLPYFPWEESGAAWETSAVPMQGPGYNDGAPSLPPIEPDFPNPVLEGRVEKGNAPGGGGTVGDVLGSLLGIGIPLALGWLQQRLALNATQAKLKAEAYQNFSNTLAQAPKQPRYAQPQRPPLPMQPLSGPSAPPSNVLKGMAQKTLTTLQDAQHQRLLDEVRQLQETGRGRPDLMIRIADAYGPSQMSNLPPLQQSQPGDYDTYTPPVDPNIQQAMANLLNPASGADTPFIFEDPSLIAANLAHGQQPADVTVYLRRQQERAMAEAQWQAQQAQANLAAEQARTEQLKQSLLLAQQQMLQKQNTTTPLRVNRPSVSIRQQDGETTDVWQKLEQGEVLDDREMKHLFHALDLQNAQAATDAERLQADMLREFAMQTMAENTVQQAERTEQGEVLIQGAPVRAEDARYFAEQDIRHFEQTDTHLRPEQLMAQAYSYEGSRPGTRPLDESGAAYQMLNRSADELQRIGITDAQKLQQEKMLHERALRLDQTRQRLISLYTDAELKKEFGPHLEVAAFQLAGRIEQNKLLYGLDNLVRNFGKTPTSKSLQPIPELKPSELSLMARYDKSFPWMQFIYNTLMNKSILKIPGNNPGFWQGQIQGKTLDMGKHLIKQYNEK